MKRGFTPLFAEDLWLADVSCSMVEDEQAQSMFLLEDLLEMKHTA